MLEAPLEIRSYRGPYTATFNEEPFDGLPTYAADNTHFLIDKQVAELYRTPLAHALNAPSAQLIMADEEHKSFDRIQGYVDALLERGVRRNHTLVAIGGGIIQDITCFMASVLFRGMRWDFYPTTLLAQADSCIGSKSSINTRGVKNLFGTFHAPRRISISTAVLGTLSDADVRSGIGEMIKVHIIDGPASFDAIAGDYDAILRDPAVMKRYIRRSLEIKKGVIEKDEFDEGLRNIMNYGHSFGHAIEAATDFAIPHGIAVTIGMAMANTASRRMGRITETQEKPMNALLARNYRGFEKIAIPEDRFFGAIGKDKKNEGKALSLILPKSTGSVEKMAVPFDDGFKAICRDFFKSLRAPTEASGHL